ncbi:hypothetical protein VQ02_19870 [Methylobacterium variabile]|uniref:HNH endonuclease n=1 Tax=Methylobacterium variabile TaxID=298794 RepID=A0A0J6SJU2_9HYPH|nr:hypothetical protein VQ02_19870 [Methylobacterium variabile]
MAVRNKEYASANRAKYLAHTRSRQARKMQATPVWADLKKIEAIYAEAARLTAETGVPHHVDHIYPLRGKTMCGLHVENNLQILTAVENLSKGNRVDDPG